MKERRHHDIDLSCDVLKNSALSLLAARLVFAGSNCLFRASMTTGGVSLILCRPLSALPRAWRTSTRPRYDRTVTSSRAIASWTAASCSKSPTSGCTRSAPTPTTPTTTTRTPIGRVSRLVSRCSSCSLFTDFVSFQASFSLVAFIVGPFLRKRASLAQMTRYFKLSERIQFPRMLATPSVPLGFPSERGAGVASLSARFTAQSIGAHLLECDSRNPPPRRRWCT